ncbi:MAG: VOC family protein [Ignavibacteriales bacterium]|nr:MAG: VOC family protein [Ignavibacteriales bacterium]
MQKISPFIWFDNNAEEAVNFYTSLFQNSKINKTVRYDEASAKAAGRPAGSVLTISFQLEGQNFTALNGGPHFKLNQSISLFAYCESDKKIENIYNKLCEAGNVIFKLDKYDWSPKYAWVVDKFGLSWQLDVEKINSPQKIVPALLFSNEKNQKIKEAISFYSSVFPDSKTMMEFPYQESAGLPEGTLLFAQFKLAGYLFNSMSSTLKHDFDFNEALSFVVDCNDQDEVDHYWNKLTSGGGQESMCGWLKDRYGVSWQIVPRILFEMLNDKDPAKAKKAMTAMLQMRKIDIAGLEKACRG